MRKLSESIWSDIQDRSSGDTVRKEDDVNLLDRDGFYNYIMEHYKAPYTIVNAKSVDFINIPIIEDDKNEIHRLIIWDFDNGEKHITLPRIEPFLRSKLFVKIRSNFVLKKGGYFAGYDFNPLYVVQPKGDYKKTEMNKFFIDVIDFIIDNVEEPYKSLLTRI